MAPMPALLRSLSCAAAAALALAACDPRFVHSSDLSPREVQTLAGVWQGQASLSFGSEYGCPRTYLWTVRVSGGTVDGGLVDQKTPNASPAQFSTFLDYDGSLHVSVRPNERPLDVLGSFSRDGFSGTARSKECVYAIRLRRVESKT